MREAAGSPEGWQAAVRAGTAVALTANEMFTHPQEVEAVKQAFAAARAKAAGSSTPECRVP